MPLKPKDGLSGPPVRKVIQREISRALLVNLSGKPSGGKHVAPFDSHLDVQPFGRTKSMKLVLNEADDEPLFRMALAPLPPSMRTTKS
jgi:hypothetical protein